MRRIQSRPTLFPPVTLATAWLLFLAAGAPAPAHGSELLVASTPDGAVRRHDATTGAFLDTLVDPGSGGLAIPSAMVLGPDGNLYVTDAFNDRVRRYDGQTGAFLGDFVAAGSGGLSEPLDLVFGADGSLYVASCGDSVLRYHGSTGAFLGAFVPEGSGGLNCASSLAFGPGGDLFVASNDTGQVLRYHGTTGAFLGVFVSDYDGSLTFGPDGNLYLGTNDGVRRYSGSTGAFLDTFVADGSGGLENARDLVFGPNEDLYVANDFTFSTGNVLRYNGSAGAFLDVFVPEGSGGLMNPRALLLTGICTSSSTALCLTGSRFRVEATWRTPDGQTGPAQAFQLTPDSGYFWFFNAANAELFVKVRDACVPAYDRFWFFAAGLTNVRVDITVTDTKTGESKPYTNPLNRPFAPIQDTDAFATCP